MESCLNYAVVIIIILLVLLPLRCCFAGDTKLSNVKRISNPRAHLLFCSLKLLFFNVFVAIDLFLKEENSPGSNLHYI